MCDFHSTVWRASDGAVAHISTNSHSEAVERAGWRENQPNRKPFFFEAEWDGEGRMPSPERLIRNNVECPEDVREHIIAHYERLQKALTSGEGLDDYFVGEQWSDVHARALVKGVTNKLPEKCGALDLRSLTTLPEGVVLPEKCGALDLRSLTTLPEGVVLPKEIDGYLYLSSLTTLPEGDRVLSLDQLKRLLAKDAVKK